MKNKFNIMDLVSLAIGGLGLGIMAGIIVGKATSSRRKPKDGYHIDATINQITPSNKK